MLAYIQNNFATIIIGAVVLAVAALAVFVMIRDRRRGKSACGYDCGHCPSASLCHDSKRGHKAT